MKDAGKMLLENWEWILAAILILIWIMMQKAKSRLLGFEEVKPMEATQILNHQDAIILDVREADEYVQGHILNAIHIPLGALESRVNELEKFKDNAVLLSCRSGQRSAQAGVILKRNGFEKLFKISGGLRAWRNDNLPLTKG
ncbi:MAG: rhodanese-like domain-containing protein [Gammaproteobacteria bacterium]